MVQVRCDLLAAQPHQRVQHKGQSPGTALQAQPGLVTSSLPPRSQAPARRRQHPTFSLALHPPPLTPTPPVWYHPLQRQAFIRQPATGDARLQCRTCYVECPALQEN